MIEQSCSQVQVWGAVSQPKKVTCSFQRHRTLADVSGCRACYLPLTLQVSHQPMLICYLQNQVCTHMQFKADWLSHACVAEYRAQYNQGRLGRHRNWHWVDTINMVSFNDQVQRIAKHPYNSQFAGGQRPPDPCAMHERRPLEANTAPDQCVATSLLQTKHELV